MLDHARPSSSVTEFARSDHEPASPSDSDLSTCSTISSKEKSLSEYTDRLDVGER